MKKGLNLGFIVVFIAMMILYSMSVFAVVECTTTIDSPFDRNSGFTLQGLSRNGTGQTFRYTDSDHNISVIELWLYDKAGDSTGSFCLDLWNTTPSGTIPAHRLTSYGCMYANSLPDYDTNQARYNFTGSYIAKQNQYYAWVLNGTIAFINQVAPSYAKDDNDLFFDGVIVETGNFSLWANNNVRNHPFKTFECSTLSSKINITFSNLTNKDIIKDNFFEYEEILTYINWTYEENDSIIKDGSCTLNISNIGFVYNSTLNLYQANDSFYFTTSKNHTINISCIHDTENRYNQEILKILTIKNIPPRLNLDYVNNSYGLTPVYPFVTVEYARSNHTFYYNITDNDLSFYNFSVFNSSNDIIGSQTGTDSGQHYINIDYLSFIDNSANPINISLFANDTDKDFSYLSYLIYVNDTITPQCSGLKSRSLYNNTLYEWNINCTDENFFSFNLSCDNNISRYVDGLNVKKYSYYNQTLITDNIICKYQYCDGHTNSNLDEDWYIRNEGDKIEFEVLGQTHELKVINTNITFDYEIEKDRIGFNVTFEDVPVFSDTDLIFEYTTSPHAYYINNDDYTAWIIDPVSKTWFDLNTQINENIKDVNVIRWNSTTFKIYLTIDNNINNYSDTIEFKSIGELNCVSGTQILSIKHFKGNEGWGVFNNDTCLLNQSLSYVIGFMIILFFTIFFIIINSKTLDFPFVNFLSGVVFFGFGVSVFNCSNYMSIPFFLFGLLLWLYEILGNTK